MKAVLVFGGDLGEAVGPAPAGILRQRLMGGMTGSLGWDNPAARATADGRWRTH